MAAPHRIQHAKRSISNSAVTEPSDISPKYDGLTQFVVMQASQGNIRYTFDGSNPQTSGCTMRAKGPLVTALIEDFKNAKFIGVSGNAVLNLYYFASRRVTDILDELSSSSSISTSSSSVSTSSSVSSSSSSSSSVSSSSSSSESSSTSSSISTSSSSSSQSSSSISTSSSSQSGSSSSQSLSGDYVQWPDGTIVYWPDGTPMVWNSDDEQLGFNEANTKYWNVSRAWIDLGKTASPYYGNSSGSVIDEATGDMVSGSTAVNINRAGGEKLEEGTYVVSHTGSGSGPSSFTVSNGDGAVNLNFSGEINDLSIKRASETETYTASFTARAQKSKCIRWMDAWDTNVSEYDSDNPYVRRIVAPSNTFFHKLITPADIRAEADAHNHDVWLTFHHLASDANITAALNEFTDFSGRVYVEHSNEVWNSSFPQYTYALGQSNAYAGPGDAQNVQAWHGDRTDEIGELAKATLPGCIVVWGTQMAVPNFINSLQYSTRALSYIDAVAIAPYFGGVWSRAQSSAAIAAMTNAEIADEAENDFNTRVKPLIQSWITNAATRSWLLLGYEGGAHLDHASSTTEAILQTASQAAEMGPVYDAYLTYWHEQVGTLLCLFESVGDNVWGHKQYELEADSASPRWQQYLNRFN